MTPIRMERLFLQLIKEKLTSLDNPGYPPPPSPLYKGGGDYYRMRTITDMAVRIIRLLVGIVR